MAPVPRAGPHGAQPRLVAPWSVALAGVGIALVLAMLAWRTVIAPQVEIDFRAFWVAGRLWLEGTSPYAPGFEARGRLLLPIGNTVNLWFYPPNWWLPCVGLALLGHDAATMVWRLVNVAALVGGTILLVDLLLVGRARAARFVLVAAALVLMIAIEPTGQAIGFGQSAPILYAGLCLTIAGLARSDGRLLAAGLILLALKPQLAIPFYLYALALRDGRLPALIAIAAGALLAAPHLLTFGLGSTLRDLLANLAAYGRFPVNTARNVAGPVRLLDLAGVEVAPTLQLAAATLLGSAAAVLAAWRGISRTRTGLLLSAILVALLPLHIYELDLLLAPLLLAIGLGGRITWDAAAAVALLIRPSRIEAALGIGGVQIGGHVLATLAAFLVLARAILLFAEAWRGGGGRATLTADTREQGMTAQPIRRTV